LVEAPRRKDPRKIGGTTPSPNKGGTKRGRDTSNSRRAESKKGIQTENRKDLPTGRLGAKGGGGDRGRGWVLSSGKPQGKKKRRN